jgi:uncharacterized membrane protein YbhN (UPF0104 family)
VVLATANHFLADAAAGLTITALGLLAARATTRPDATEAGPGGAGPAATSPALGPGAATRHRRPLIWWRLLATVSAAAMAARRAGGAARWLARHAGRSRWRWRLATGLAGLARHRLGPRQGAAALAASGLSVLAEAGLLAAAFAVAGTPVPWRGLLLACAAGQLGARLVPLPGGLGGMEGGVLGALALIGTRPATALTAVFVYRVAGYWAPGAAGAITAAVLTRRHPAQAARPVTPLRPQAPAWPPSPCGGRPAADHPDSAGPDRGARTRTSGHRAALKSRAGTRSRSTAQEHVMIRSHHQQHQLQRIETGLLRSDPQLTAMLGIFGKLSAGQAMPAWEQVPATRRDRIRQTAALTVQAITLAAAAIGLLLSAVLALLIVVVGTRHSHRLPAPGPDAPAVAGDPTAAQTRQVRAYGR